MLIMPRLRCKVSNATSFSVVMLKPMLLVPGGSVIGLDSRIASFQAVLTAAPYHMVSLVVRLTADAELQLCLHPTPNANNAVPLFIIPENEGHTKVPVML